IVIIPPIICQYLDNIRINSIIIPHFYINLFYYESSKHLYKATAKTALLMIRFCVSVNDAVFNYIISINKVMNSFLINVILLKFFLIYTLKNILLNNNKLFKLLINEDIFISIYFSI